MDIQVEKIWLTEKEAEAYSTFSRKILANARTEGRLRYRAYRDARKIIYHRKDLDAFIERECRLYETTDERIKCLAKH